MLLDKVLNEFDFRSILAQCLEMSYIFEFYVNLNWKKVFLDQLQIVKQVKEQYLQHLFLKFSLSPEIESKTMSMLF